MIKFKTLEQSQSLATVPHRNRVSRFFGQKVVKPGLHLRFSLIIFSLFSVVVFLNWLVGRLTIKHMFEMGLVNSDQFGIQMEVLNNILVKSSILGMIVVYEVCLVVSHMIAGPIYRFERDLESILEGDLNVKFRLRKYDEFKELADLFNRVFKSLKDRFNEYRENVSLKADQALAILKKSSGKKGSPDEELVKILKSIKSDHIPR